MPDTVVDLILHGEPVGGRRYRGNGTDDPERWYRIRIDCAGMVRIRHDRFGPVLECVNARRVRRSA